MKYVIFSDIHGKSLKPLEERLKRYGNSESLRLICMGDFDDADVINEARDLIRKYNGIIVPGNHDEMLYKKHVDFHSETFGAGRSAYLYALKLHYDPGAICYLDGILKQQLRLLPIVGECQGNDKQFSNAIVVHGGLAGKLSSQKFKENGMDKLWYRLYIDEILCDAYAEDNFKDMKRRICNIMIRGHDHVQAYAYKRENGSIDVKSQRGAIYNLLQSRMHIINPGPYFKGDYAIISTECLAPELSFHNLEEND